MLLYTCSQEKALEQMDNAASLALEKSTREKADKKARDKATTLVKNMKVFQTPSTIHTRAHT